MTTPREKALSQFPAMYVTLVSVVQAIALEALVSRVSEVGPLSMAGWDVALLWLEIGLLGQTIFYVWVSYTLLVTLAQWVFRIFDFGSAFAVGVFQLVAIGWVGPQTIKPFFLMVSVGFFSGAWISLSNTGAAAGREENRKTMELLPRRAIVVLLTLVGMLGLVGLVVGDVHRYGPVPASILLVIANGLLLLAQLKWFRWWERVMRPERGESAT